MHFSLSFGFGLVGFRLSLHRSDLQFFVNLSILDAPVASHVIFCGNFLPARVEQTSSMSTTVLQHSATSLGLKRVVDSTKTYIDLAAGLLVLMNLGSVKERKKIRI